MNRAVIEPQLDDECREIGAILAQVPDFAAQCDYGWAAERESYDVPSEAAFQRRALLMLVKYWIEAPDRTELPGQLTGVIVTQEFITRFGLCSPRIRSIGIQCRLLSIPASFVELALWLFVGLRCWTAMERGVGRDHGDDGGWSLVTTAVPQRSPQSFVHVSTNELIARTLAERGRDRALHGTNAALLIREQVPGLAGEAGEVDTDRLPFFDQNATYMVGEFALAHELGHLLSGHDLGGGAAPDADQTREADADRVGCLLLAMTAQTRLFGWGLARHDAWVQAAIGMALFDCLLTGRTALADSLLRRPGIAPVGEKMIANERLRAAIARLQLTDVLLRLARSGHAEDAQRIATLVDNADAFLRDVRASAAALPDAQIRLALQIAEQSAHQIRP